MKSLFSRAIDNLDITLAVVGCGLSIPLTVYLGVTIQRPIYTTVGVVSFLACLAYLVMRHKSLPPLQIQVDATQRTYLLLNILFFCLLTYSIAAFYLRPDPYTRPLGYFVSTALMVAVLAVELLFLPSRKSTTYFALFKIVLIGLSVAWSVLLMFPSHTNGDPWWHEMVVSQMLDSGHMPEGHMYSNLPCFHLVVGATSLITGLSYKMASMFSISLLQVVCLASFIFLLGKFIHSAKAGLLAALFLVTANWVILFGYNTIPNTMAMTLIPIIIYLLFKSRQEKPIVSICLSALLMIVLILTHSIGALSLAMLLFLIWLGFEIYKKMRYQEAASGKIFLFTWALFTAAMLAWWMFATPYGAGLLSLIRTGFAASDLSGPPPGIVPPPSEVMPSLMTAISQYRNSLPFTEQLFNQSSVFLFFALAFIGSLAMLSRALINRHGFALVIGGLVILAITFSGLIFQLSFLNIRWSYFSQVLLAIPIGIAFLWLGGLFKRKIGSACLVGGMAFLISFAMIMSPSVNMDNQLLSPNTVSRHAATESELQAASTVSNLWDGKVGADGYFYGTFECHLGTQFVSLDEAFYSGNFSDCQDMLVTVRKQVAEDVFRPHGCPFRLSNDPRLTLAKQGFSCIYNCVSVSAFVWNGH